MSQTQSCSNCLRSVDVSRLTVGQTATCPYCKARFIIDGAGGGQGRQRPANGAKTRPGGGSPRSAHRPKPGAGQLTVDGFKGIQYISRGAMGTVYAAYETRLGRKVALKVLDSSLAAKDSTFIERFKREGQTLAAINHPNVVRIHRLVQGEEVKDGVASEVHIIVMEFVDGQTLRDYRTTRKPPLRDDIGEVFRIFHEMIQGVAAIHAKGVVHRDLKPDNIMLERQDSNDDGYRSVHATRAALGCEARHPVRRRLLLGTHPLRDAHGHRPGGGTYTRQQVE